MTNLISGKEALIALANGKTVEVKRIHDNEWQPAQIFGVSVFTDSETTSFRLKPRTITINGIHMLLKQNEAHIRSCSPRSNVGGCLCILRSSFYLQDYSMRS